MAIDQPGKAPQCPQAVALGDPTGKAHVWLVRWPLLVVRGSYLASVEEQAQGFLGCAGDHRNRTKTCLVSRRPILLGFQPGHTPHVTL